MKAKTKKKRIVGPKFTPAEKRVIKKVERVGINKLKDDEKLLLRVVVAKDVKAQLTAETLIAKRGISFSALLTKDQAGERVPWNAEDTQSACLIQQPKQQLQKTLKSAPCFGCAKGSALLAFVRRFDGMNGQRFNDQMNEMWDGQGGEMNKLFSPEVLRAMERIFERDTAISERVGSMSDNKRLNYIMDNLIKSGGANPYPKDKHDYLLTY